MAVLYRQTDALKSRALAAMKAEGMEYDERMEELDKIDYPKPNEEFLYATFNIFAERHPWVGNDILRPKSIARDMYEQGMTFVEYVKEYGLQRSEGVLLRYLTDSYKALVQTVPESAKTDPLYDLCDWLGLSVRYVDASLIDEWEQLQSPIEAGAAPPERESNEAPDITKDVRGFTTMARNTVWKLVRLLAFKQYDRTAEALADSGDQDWGRRTPARGHWQTTGLNTTKFRSGLTRGAVSRLTSSGAMPSGHSRRSSSTRGTTRGWRMLLKVDLAASREAGAPQLRLISINQ